MRATRYTTRKKFLIVVLAIGLAGFSSSALAAKDHTGFFDGPLNSGPEATKACLECHEDASTQVMATSHWTWSSPQTIDGKKVNRGKINAVNNF